MRYLLTLLLIALTSCAPLPRSNLYVIDGDSVRVLDENVRLMGFDTPETFQPKCASERALGKRATIHLEHLIENAGSASIVYERKRDGSLRRDKYRRLLGTLYIDGVDVADLQINAGLARPYDGGKRRSWCGNDA